MIANLEALVHSAVSEVFATMLSLEMRPLPPASCAFNGAPQIASAVGFTGQLSGVVYLYTTVRFAHRITRGLLGLAPAEPSSEEMVNDAMGEIANMVVGHIKSRLTDHGLACVMTIPSIVRGSQFDIEAVSQTDVNRLAFQQADDCLVVEVLLQGTPSASS